MRVLIRVNCIGPMVLYTLYRVTYIDKVLYYLFHDSSALLVLRCLVNLSDLIGPVLHYSPRSYPPCAKLIIHRILLYSYLSSDDPPVVTGAHRFQGRCSECNDNINILYTTSRLYVQRQVLGESARTISALCPGVRPFQRSPRCELGL